jgi:hypothetical protein
VVAFADINHITAAGRIAAAKLNGDCAIYLSALLIEPMILEVIEAGM